jgi:hypothetical protein
LRQLLTLITCGCLAPCIVGCGAGIGDGPVSGEAEISVTRDYGRGGVAGPANRQIRSADTVMSLLDEVADVSTGYGGRFVEAIDGIGSSGGSRNADWFYFVNGVEAEIGAAAFRPREGDVIWWDFRDWTDAMWVGAVTGAYPAPLRGGYDGTWDSVRLSCLTGERICRQVRRELEDDGIAIGGGPADSKGGEIKVLIGPVDAVERDSGEFGLGLGPASSGVFIRLAGPRGRSRSGRLETLDERGRVTGRFGAGTGLVAAVREQGKPPVWLVTGTDERGVKAASAVLDPDKLRRTYAVVVPPGGGDPLPVPTPSGRSGQ